VGGKPDRMVLDLHVLAGERAGPTDLPAGRGGRVLGLAMGVSARRGSRAADTGEEVGARGPVPGVQLGMTTAGLWQVTRWGRADAGVTGDGNGTGTRTRARESPRPVFLRLRCPPRTSTLPDHP
jgi:hypothetical protein